LAPREGGGPFYCPAVPLLELGDSLVEIGPGQYSKATHALEPLDFASDSPRSLRLALGVGIVGSAGRDHVSPRARSHSGQSHRVACAKAVPPWMIGIGSPSGVRGRHAPQSHFPKASRLPW